MFDEWCDVLHWSVIHPALLLQVFTTISLNYTSLGGHTSYYSCTEIIMELTRTVIKDQEINYHVGAWCECNDVIGVLLLFNKDV